MELTDVVLSLLLAIVTASSGVIQVRLFSIERELATKPSREEFEALRAELETKPGREEFDALRGDVDALRTDMTAMRSDLTQIALAIGVSRPQASEG
jgi:hypothetical protein